MRRFTFDEFNIESRSTARSRQRSLSFVSLDVMRVAVWATTSVIALLVALWCVLSNAPSVGGGSVPYETFTPRGGDVLFYVGLLLFIIGIVLVVVRPRRKCGLFTWRLRRCRYFYLLGGRRTTFAQRIMMRFTRGKAPMLMGTSRLAT